MNSTTSLSTTTSSVHLISTTHSESTTTVSPADSVFCKTIQWYIILGASLGSYIVFLIFTYIVHAILNWKAKSHAPTFQHSERAEKFYSFIAWLQFKLQSIVNGTDLLGKTILIINALCVVVSFSVYVYMTYIFIETNEPYEYSPGRLFNRVHTGKAGLRGCVSKHNWHAVYVDYACNIYFLFFYLIRFLASDDYTVFLLTFEAFSDHMTIVPAAIMYYFDKYMIVFQFLRLSGLKYLLNLVIYFGLLKGRKMIRLMVLLIQIVTVWAVSAGLFQLVESVGNFWSNNTRSMQEPYFSCIYFLLITMSTVGYGDFSPETYMGRIFIIFFIILALGMFTSIIPEISAILTEDRRYKRAVYQSMKGKKHVIVCGNITLNSIKNFMNDFFNRATTNLRVAFLSESEPDIAMEALLKTRELYVSYYQGDIMNTNDLQRVCVNEASAVIILANLQSLDSETEDLNNIMRVIAIKDFCPNVPVLVVLSKYRSKTYLMNIPDWEPQKGDAALCINELKMGVLSQSCYSPGFSTFICNLLMPCITMKRPLMTGRWEYDYYNGTKFSIYKVEKKLSSYFQEKLFSELAAYALENLNICVLAVEVPEDLSDQSSSKRVILNPGTTLTIDTETMHAFVIAESQKDADRLSDCIDSKSNNVSKSHKKNNNCKSIVSDSPIETEAIELGMNSQNSHNLTSTMTVKHFSKIKPNSSDKLDSTGFFYWVKKNPIASKILHVTDKHDFKNHIILCILDTDKSRGTNIGLSNFIMPLRASIIKEEKLKDIIIVGDVGMVVPEWYTLENFPRLYILNTTPMNRAHLKAVNIEQCYSCMILAPKVTPDPHHDHACALLMDKETILCTLNIKTMRDAEGRLLDDRIHLITEINSEEAIDYLDQDDDPIVSDATMSQAFATGRTFFQGLLDNLVCTTFFDRSSIDLLRTMVTTVNSEDFEVELNEQGFQLQGYEEFQKGRQNNRSHVELIGIDDEPAKSIFTRVSQRWKVFSVEMLNIYEIVCVAISRLQSDNKEHRYIITFPPATTLIQANDKILCIMPPQRYLEQDAEEVDDFCSTKSS